MSEITKELSFTIPDEGNVLDVLLKYGKQATIKLCQKYHPVGHIICAPDIETIASQMNL